MIAVIDIQIQAANPSLPLFPMRSFIGSPSSIRVRNVPKKIGNWKITQVYLNAEYPDNSSQTVQCSLVGGVWVGTIVGSSQSGFISDGYTIFADGIDENGDAINGYILGKGDVTIYNLDRTITNDIKSRVYLLSAEPTAPKDGDLWQLSGTWYIYQDGTAYPIGADSGLIQQLSARVDSVETAISSKADVSSLNHYLPLSGGTMSDNNQSAEIAPWGIGLYNDYTLTSRDTYTHTFDVRTKMAVDFSMLSDSFDGTSLIDKFSAKQDKLSDPQISAIDSVVDELATVIEFQFVPTHVYNWSGEINKQTMIDVGLYDDTQGTWNEQPTTIKIGTAVTRLGNQVFAGCWFLTKVDIPSSISSVGDYAFDGCYGLASVTIPNSVTSIGDYVFYGCEGLTSVTIPNSVTSIGFDAFDYCTNLSSITVVGKTQVQAEALLLNADVPSGCEITTWNDASKEYVDAEANYSMISSGTIQLENKAVQCVEISSSGMVLSLPNSSYDKVLDFVVDIKNTTEISGTTTSATFELSGTIGTDYNIVIPTGESFTDMTTLSADELAEFYFTKTAFQLDNIPTWKIVKQSVEKYTIPTI